MIHKKFPFRICDESQDILERFYLLHSKVDPKYIWDQYPRGDHLLWFACQIQIDSRLIGSTACDCAEKALVFIPENESLPAKYVQSTRDWLNGSYPSAFLLEDVSSLISFYHQQSQIRPEFLSTGYFPALLSIRRAMQQINEPNCAYLALTNYVHANVRVSMFEAIQQGSDGIEEGANARRKFNAETADLVRSKISWTIVESKLKELQII